MNLKIHIDPKTMVEYVKKCLHCNYGYDMGCKCRFPKVYGYWNGLKFTSKKKWCKLAKPTSEIIMYPVQQTK